MRYVPLQRLRELADNGIVNVKHSCDDIYRVTFSVGGAKFSAQFDGGNENEVYHFECLNPSELLNILWRTKQ